MPKTKGTRAVNGQKRCSKCLQMKPVSEFNKSVSHRDGFDPQCKSCKAEQYQKRKTK